MTGTKIHYYGRALVAGKPTWIEYASPTADRGRTLSAAPYEGGKATGPARDFAPQDILEPSTPTKIVCVGLNYRAHAAEMEKPVPEEPLLFMKPLSTILAPGGTIRLPAKSHEVHYEGELGIVMARTAYQVRPKEASDYILGFTIVNDVTARDIQHREKVYTRAKGFNTFCPFGPVVVIGQPVQDLLLITRVNGQERQRRRTSDMIFDAPAIVASISEVMPLNPGDLIATGTPPGVGPLQPGDTVEVEIEKLGVLRNTVAR